MKMFLDYIINLILKTFYKKKYYERSPSKAIVPYMNKNKIQVHEDKFEEWLTDNQDELKEAFRKAINNVIEKEKRSAKNLKVESLEDRKDKE